MAGVAPSIAEEFDAVAWQALLVAAQRGREEGRAELTCAQVLLALIEQQEAVPPRLLAELGIDVAAVYNFAYGRVAVQPGRPGPAIVLSAPLAAAIADARDRARGAGVPRVTAALLLAGLAAVPSELSAALAAHAARIADLAAANAALTGPGGEERPLPGTEEERAAIFLAIAGRPSVAAILPARLPFRFDRRAGAIAGALVLLLVVGTTSAVLVIRSKQQVVVVRPVAAVTFGDQPVTLSARATSGLPVRFSVASGPCTVDGDVLTVKGAGTCRVRASQAGEDGWHNPTSTTVAIPIGKAAQTISFGPVAAMTHGDPPFAVQATASSGQPVTVTASGSCTAAGATITISRSGNCRLTAEQDGTSDYLPATPVTQSFDVAPLRLANGRVLIDSTRDGLGQLTIQNGQDLDAVAVLTTPDNKTVFSVSIQAQQTYEIDGIRDGTYNLFFELGHDWNDQGGNFNQDSSMTRFQDPFVFRTVPVPGALQYETFTVTLQPVAGGTAATQPVPPSEFPSVH